MSSPFALPFHQALSSERFLSRIRESGEDQLRIELGQGLGGAAKTSLALGKFVYERGRLLVELPAGAKTADLMVANGKRVAQLREVAGKAGPRLQVVGGGAKVGVNAAALALIVIEASHMTSAHDNAKRIKRIERRTKQLVEFGEAELVAELEACYRQAKEICLAAGEEQTEHDRAFLSQIGQSLFRIRAQWRHRLRHNLAGIDKATAAWWTSVVRWKRGDSLNNSKEQRSVEANESCELLQLMQFSLMLQFALSQKTGRARSFIDHTLADEVEQWRELAEFARVKGETIFEGGMHEGFRGFVAGIEGIAAYWEVLTEKSESYETTASEYAEAISRPVAAARQILNAQFAQGRCDRAKRGNRVVYIFKTKPTSLS
jgi:hypothetical protein